MCRIDSTNILTYTYMYICYKRVICIDLKGDYNTKTHQKSTTEPNLGAWTKKNVNFDASKGWLPLNFFQQNFRYIILPLNDQILIWRKKIDVQIKLTSCFWTFIVQYVKFIYIRSLICFFYQINCVKIHVYNYVEHFICGLKLFKWRMTNSFL